MLQPAIQCVLMMKRLHIKSGLAVVHAERFDWEAIVDTEFVF
jgi:hypothetical protein